MTNNSNLYGPRNIEDGIGVSGSGSQSVALGTQADDYFHQGYMHTGSSYGFGGNDHFTAGGNFYGGDGDDIAELIQDSAGSLWGNNGDDSLYGSKYSNDLYGGLGDDIIYGGDWPEPKDDEALKYYQYSAADNIYGGLGSDTLYGSNGHDFLSGGNSMQFAGKGNYLDGREGQDTYVGGWGNDTFVYDREDFEGSWLVPFIPRGENGIIYSAHQGFDTLTSVVGNIDFTGMAYREDGSTETGNVISGVEAVVATASFDDVLTINAYAIQAQSDDTAGNDWDGFIAYLGEGEDTFNLVGTGWTVTDDASTALVTPQMLELAGLSEAQQAELNAYVFENCRDGSNITIWTDAEQGYINDELFV